MKKLFVTIFKEMFNIDVRVINIPQDNIDVAIFIAHDRKMRKMSEKKLAEYDFDYAVTRNGNSWVYLQATHLDALVRNNEVISPPETIVTESVQTYTSAEKAFLELTKSIFSEKTTEIIREWEMVQ